MFVLAVTVQVVPGGRAAFVEAILDNARHARGEPGNVRFDVLQALDDPDRFLLYEAYRSEADFKAHQQTAHYLRFKEAAGPLMAQPRVGLKHRSLFPPDGEF